MPQLPGMDLDWSFLSFLGAPWFVIAWYALGLLGAAFVIYDARNHNTVLKPAMQWAWPVIVFFFSVIGVALYLGTARARGVGRLATREQKERAHQQLEQSMWRRVNGASSHCVAGDGFGIMTAMVIARAGGLSFWQEFWFEYLVGFAMGWFIFQRKSMTMMTDSLPKQLAMAFRAEFFSMLTVMGGMGAVMTFITPHVATAQPKPLTAAFWGFGMLGLLVGYVLTFPMNWLLVMVGWKHGMGDASGAKKARSGPARFAAFATVGALGAFGLFLPAWLTYARQRAPVQSAAVQGPPADAIYRGLEQTLEQAREALARGDRTRGSVALDQAYRLADVATYSAPGSFYAAFDQIKNARYALQQGQLSAAQEHLTRAERVASRPSRAWPALLEPGKYQGAKVLDARGAEIGEVMAVRGDKVELALGGWRDAWGFVDFSKQRRVEVTLDALAFGPPRDIGRTMVVLPTPALAVAAR